MAYLPLLSLRLAAQIISLRLLRCLLKVRESALSVRKNLEVVLNITRGRCNLVELIVVKHKLRINVCVRHFEGVLHVLDLQVQQTCLLVQLAASLVQNQLLNPLVYRCSFLQLGLLVLALQLLTLLQRKPLELDLFLKR